MDKQDEINETIHAILLELCMLHSNSRRLVCEEELNKLGKLRKEEIERKEVVLYREVK